jgi:hypothetical protein
MIWLFRLVLSSAPLLALALAGGGTLGGLGLNWWFQITDWQTVVIFTVALAACVYVAQTNSPLSRLGVTIIIGVAAYLKGGIDKQHSLEAKHAQEIVALHEAHKRDIVLLHEGYRRQSQIEEERQKAANAKALADAASEKSQVDADLAAARSEVERLNTEASKDVHANRPSLSIDAIRRLNRLRGGVPGSS